MTDWNETTKLSRDEINRQREKAKGFAYNPRYAQTYQLVLCECGMVNNGRQEDGKNCCGGKWGE